MAYLQYGVRHMQRTVEDRIQARLVALGWIGPAENVPFGQPPVTFQRDRLEESELRTVEGNMVVVAFGNEPDDEPLEMGGGLMQTDHVFFVDCIGTDQTIALMIATDIKDDLAGRAPGTNRYTTVLNHMMNPPTPVLGHSVEFTDVIRERPDSADFRRNWHVVKATASYTRIAEDPDV